MKRKYRNKATHFLPWIQVVLVQQDVTTHTKYIHGITFGNKSKKVTVKLALSIGGVKQAQLLQYTAQTISACDLIDSPINSNLTNPEGDRCHTLYESFVVN